tara:strand:+ start:3074 stop:3274 length:201 start_codon:yes stop_codon:yes gene_type:complete
MPITKSDLSILRSAVNGDVSLDTDNPSLFNRIFKLYEKRGVEFYGDPEDDYEILIDHIASDIGYAF